MVTDEFIAITAGIVLLYYYMYNNPVRWKRLAGCLGIMIMSVGLGVLADTIPFLILMFANFIVAGIKFIEDVSTIGAIIR